MVSLQLFQDGPSRAFENTHENGRNPVNTSSNAPVHQAKQLLDSGKVKLLSLDIFDTCVWRTFPVPTDLFYALGEAAKEKGLLYPSSSSASFVVERIEAEKRARAVRETNSEATLEEIYECFPAGYMRTGSPEDLMALELEIEREATHPDPQIVELIEYAAAKGIGTAYVSDTYFDLDHLRKIVPHPSDLIFNSCRFRTSKCAGLHRQLLRESRLAADRVLHLGDNLDADFHAPARLGITTIWRPRYPEWARGAIHTELPPTRSERSSFFPGTGGDGGLNALRAQATDDPKIISDPYCAWGSTVLGPVIGGFAQWVVERCSAERIGTALCLMREGKILKPVVDRFESDLETIEFYTSRYAVVKASIFEATRAELVRFLARPQPTVAEELLEPLDLSCDDLDILPGTLISAGDAHALSDKIIADKTLRKRAAAASGRARARFMRYFHEAVPNPPDRLAIVDLGYSGTIQGCLQEILTHEKVPCITHGLYFVTGSGVRKIQLTGSRAEGFLAENGQPLAIAHSFMRSPELVEQCLMCNLGSTVDYSNDGQPVLGPQHIPEGQLAEIERVQQGLMAFVERLAKEHRADPAHIGLTKPFLEAVLVRALTMPTPIELEMFGKWVHDENLGSSRTRGLVACELDDDYVRHATAHQLASLQSANVYWIFGLAHMVSPAMGGAVRNIFLRKTDPRAFDCPDPARPIYFFWNDGEAHRADQTYQLSNSRSAWTRFTLDLRRSNLFEVGFSWGQPGEVIRIGGMILRLDQPGRPLQVIRKSPSDFETFGLERLKGVLSAFQVTEAAGVVAPVDEVRDFTGRVEVDLLFSHLDTRDTCPC